MSVNIVLSSTTITEIFSGLTPFTANFILSSLPANLSKIVFNYGDNTTDTVIWRTTSIPSSALSTLPISSNPSDLRNQIITKTFTRNSLLEDNIFQVVISAYSVLTFIPTAYNLTIGPITVPKTSATNLKDIKIIKTKYINEHKMAIIFEEQDTGVIYSVLTDPNFDTISTSA